MLTPSAEPGAEAGFSSSASRSRAPGLEGLRGLYERYCDHEARQLLTLIPKEGLRAVYAEARALHRAEQPTVPPGTSAPGPETAGGHATTEVDHAPVVDPLALAVEFVRGVLPLPPWEVWVHHYLRDRRPFLEALGVEAFPAREEPVLVDVRTLGPDWTVGLQLFCRDREWRGFLCFMSRSDGLEYRTTEIFRGARPEEFRDRFRDFQPATLEAFFRSVAP